MARLWGRKKISVVFVERVPWGGGAERVVIDIARNLDRRRFNPIIVYLYKGQHAPSAMKRHVKFIKLVPDSLRELVHATFVGILGSEVRNEWELVKYKLTCKMGCLRRFLGRLKRIALDILYRIRLQLRRLFYASQSGQIQIYLEQVLCRIKGIPYDGKPFIIPDCVPAPRLIFQLRKLKARLWSVLYRFLPFLKETSEQVLNTRIPKPVHSRAVQPAVGVSSVSSAGCCAKRPIDIYRQARLFAAYCNTLRGPVVVVPVMEEAAAMVRIALGGHPNAQWPYIISTHAWESYYLPVMYGCPGFNVDEEQRRFAEACLGAEAVLSPCTGCRDDLVEQFSSPHERTLCFPNPVDIEKIQIEAEAPLSVPIPDKCDGKNLLLHVGRLDPQKRHRLLFEACACLKKRDKNFHLLCLGDGHIRKELEELIGQLGLSEYITLLGFIENPFPYMRRARALVLSSEWESFALVLVEALACGCVPVAVDCPHGPRDVLDGGKAGFLVREDTPQALARAMYQALHDDTAVAEKLHHGAAWIERYSLVQMIPRWETLFSHIAITYSPPY